MSHGTRGACTLLATASLLGGCAVDRFPTAEGSNEPSETAAESTDSESSEATTGDGDGEPSSGDGDGEPAGDGDGEPSSGDGDGEPTGDGDGEPAGDGDGEPNFELAVGERAYGEDSAQTMLVYTADPPLPDRPMVLLAHGGLWQTGDMTSLAGTCERIVESTAGAITCASMNYRLSDSLGGSCAPPGASTYLGQVDDFASALAHIQSNAAELGVDPSAVWVGGHSAGGHLAQLLNLRYEVFAGACEGPGTCGPPAGAIGFEGIYDIGAWDAYDQSFWNGQFGCATRKAFGASPNANNPCIDPDSGQPCWEAGSPRIVAEQSGLYDAAPSGPVLLIHAPGDDWVDIAEASTFQASLAGAFPQLALIRSTDGTCATGRHNDLLMQQSLADCISTFVETEGAAIQ